MHARLDQVRAFERAIHGYFAFVTATNGTDIAIHSRAKAAGFAGVADAAFHGGDEYFYRSIRWLLSNVANRLGPDWWGSQIGNERYETIFGASQYFVRGGSHFLIFSPAVRRGADFRAECGHSVGCVAQEGSFRRGRCGCHIFQSELISSRTRSWPCKAPNYCDRRRSKSLGAGNGGDESPTG